MRFLLVTILTAALSFLAGIFLPWWSVALAAFIITVIFPLKPFSGFMAAFIGVFLLWFIMDFYFDLRNQHILSHRMALLILQTQSSLLIIIVSSLVGAITAGMAGLTGCLLRKRKPLKKSPSFGTFYSR